MNKFKQMCESMLNFFGKKFNWFEETNIPITEERPKVYKLTKKSIPRRNKLKKCDKVMKKKKAKE